MERTREPMRLAPIQTGWAAIGNGWAVHGVTQDEAIQLFQRAIEKHKEIDARPCAPEPAAKVE